MATNLVSENNTFVGVNIGCGQTPTPGWLNFDNSPSLKLARNRLLFFFAIRLRLLNQGQIGFIQFAKGANIQWADARERMPLPDASVDVVYSSHMVAFLHPEEMHSFLKESRRILKPGGWIRLVEINLDVHIERYLAHRDPGSFLKAASLFPPNPQTLKDRVSMILLGRRGGHHVIMYNPSSLCKILLEAGFKDPQSLPAGRTNIPMVGSLNLEQRKEESLYVEATNP